MLRNRSRAVTSKQGLMSDHTQAPLISPTKNPFSPISALLGSPRLFNGFLAKNLTPESEATAMSPTSILDLKNSPSFVNPFGYDRGQPKPATPSQESSNSRADEVVGLALIDSIIEEKGSEHDGSCFSKPLYRASLFGSRLKVKIPDMNDDNINCNTITPPPCSEMSPKSPADFGIKTRNSYQFLNPVSVPGNHVSREFNRQLSLKEMELSEDYTCVTTHGPNPKTTHIFDDCVVECCCADDGTQKNEVVEDGGADVVSTPHSTSPPPGFLSFCHTCRDVLAQDKDIYMYRGEKAFCSQECRCQEMFLERMENPDFDDAF